MDNITINRTCLDFSLFKEYIAWKMNKLKVQKLPLFLVAAAILLILVPNAGCPLGYDDGYAEGYSDGLDQGYDDGFDDGYEEGENEGYDKGYEGGYSEGYDYGFDDGETRGYDSGFEIGYSEGYDQGYEDALSGNIPSEPEPSILKIHFNLKRT